MIATARVLPYDYAMLDDGLVPIQAASDITMPTLVVADENSPETAQALVKAIRGAELAPARASTHELSPDEIANLVEPFLFRAGHGGGSRS